MIADKVDGLPNYSKEGKHERFCVIPNLADKMTVKLTTQDHAVDAACLLVYLLFENSLPSNSVCRRSNPPAL